MIKLNDNNHYVVVYPEYGVYQDVDPKNGLPFADESAAKKWDDAFIANMKLVDAARADAEKAVKADQRIVNVIADKLVAALGETITVTATMKDGLDHVVPLNEAFAVPVENEAGEVVLIKMATFANGVATVSLKPPRSGYYCITERGISVDGLDGQIAGQEADGFSACVGYQCSVAGCLNRLFAPVCGSADSDVASRAAGR